LHRLQPAAAADAAHPLLPHTGQGAAQDMSGLGAELREGCDRVSIGVRFGATGAVKEISWTTARDK